MLEKIQKKFKKKFLEKIEGKKYITLEFSRQAFFPNKLVGCIGFFNGIFWRQLLKVLPGMKGLVGRGWIPLPAPLPQIVDITFPSNFWQLKFFEIDLPKIFLGNVTPTVWKPRSFP